MRKSQVFCISVPYIYMKIQRMIYFLREYLFPQNCGFCGGDLLNPEDAYYGLCGLCRDYLLKFIAGYNTCNICGKRIISEESICVSCNSDTDSSKKRYRNKLILRQKLCFPYNGKFINLLSAYKFQKHIAMANFFAEILLANIKDLVQSENNEIALVPIPPKPGKIMNRGWDQIDLLSKAIDKKLKKSDSKIRVIRCLKKLRLSNWRNLNQKDLNKEEREIYSKGRVICRGRAPETAVLFDDVITTGATLNSCANALLEKGVKNIYAICLFYGR